MPRLKLTLNKLVDAGLWLTLILISYFHIVLVPYTKVEESFTLQAIHDTLAFGIGPKGREKFDHVIFTGAVPRSFVGPIGLGIVSFPILVCARFFNLVKNSADAGLVVRLTLTTLHAFSIIFFANLVIVAQTNNSITKAKLKQLNLFANTQRKFFIFIYSIQFHPLFWAGRTTPNGVVLPAVIITLALLFWKPKNEMQSGCSRVLAKSIGLGILTASAIIARLEIVGVILPIVVWTIWRGELANTIPERIIEVKGKRISVVEKRSRYTESMQSLTNVLFCGIFASLLALCISSPLDTYMWGRPFRLWNPFKDEQQRGLAWPEFEAIIFNVVEGKSSEWGVSIWHEYVSVHLAKLITFPCLLLVIIGLLFHIFQSDKKNATTAQPLSKALIVIGSHIVIMSQLGHKETRFITYLTPLLNLTAAYGASQLWYAGGGERKGSVLQLICRIFVLGVFSLTLGLTTIALIASNGNYPGGEALAKLHTLLSNENSTVHIDVLPAMTGVSLFQSLHLFQRTRKGSFGLSALPNVLSIENETLRWAYDKTENLYDSSIEGGEKLAIIETFTHILSDQQDCHFPTMFEKMKDQQVFREFDRIGVVNVRTYISNLKRMFNNIPSLFKNRDTLKEAFFLLLPIQFKWREVVWLCQKKYSSV